MDNGLNRFVLLVAIIAGFAGFLFGFDSSVIADIQDQVTQQLSLSTWQWSQVVSFSLLGSILGIPLSGLIADRLSRRTLLKLVALGFTLGTIFCAQSYGFYSMLTGRFLIGICIGIASYAAPLYIAEIAPPQRRGSLVLINGLAITFGQTAAYLLGYLIHDISETSWRLLLWIGVIPSLALLIGLYFVPHSPRWLMKRYGKEQALATLKKIRPDSPAIYQELDEIVINNTKSKSNARALFKPPVLFVLILGSLIGILQPCSGINTIMFYGPVIFKSAGFFPIKNAILATFWISMVNFLLTAITLYSVDKLGRRQLMLVGSLLAAISLFAAAMLFHYESPWQKFGILAALTVYVIGYCVSLGSLFWVIISEIYPSNVRGLAMSIATLMQWAANFLVSITFLELYQRSSEMFVFSLFGLICLLSYVISYYFLPETTHVTLEKIEENLNAGKRLRNIGQPVNLRSDKKEFELTTEQSA